MSWSKLVGFASCARRARPVVTGQVGIGTTCSSDITTGTTGMEGAVARDLSGSSFLDTAKIEKEADAGLDEQVQRADAEWRDRLRCGDSILVYSTGLREWQEGIVTQVGASDLVIMSFVGLRGRIKTMEKSSLHLRLHSSSAPHE
eukprot:TRINITY_DN7512_c0_g2_i1.p1 TRINITY_DN7512_c0_g2~~TRINITY_DN7512_c0_g2_i1.p1  ORF type:complete len:145 (+),score=16.84 TRINITY_DN7512_c0_g2_i1:53-487(+)